MKKLGFFFIIVFIGMVLFQIFVLRPEKYETKDLYEEITSRGRIKVGINTNSKPFGFIGNDGKIQGYDADLAHYIAQYILKDPEKIEFIPVTPATRLIKASTGEVDIVIATMTITPQRQEVIDFSIPYDSAGQALLVKSSSHITSIGDLGGENVGVIFGTTAEKNMKNLAPNARLIGFKSYNNAYLALKNDKISAITSDDMILKTFAVSDKTVRLLPKRYSNEPYGIGFKKGATSAKLKEELDFAITDMKQKNIINRLKKKWGL